MTAGVRQGVLPSSNFGLKLQVLELKVGETKNSIRKELTDVAVKLQDSESY